MSILVFGSINVDVAAFTPRTPRLGETVHGDRYAMGLGGKGANQAAAVARLGGKVTLAGRTGTDFFGQYARERLASFGVETAALAMDGQHATGIALILVDARGENCITVIGGANLAVDGGDVARVADRLDTASVLLLQLEVPLAPALAAAARVRAAGGIVILDPAPAPHEGLPAEAYAVADIVTPNEIETQALVGILPTTPDSARAAAVRLRERGAGAAVVKMGGNGAYFLGAQGEGFVPPFKVTPVDTVAAGDCFNGGLAFALARGGDLATATRFAAACGALATTRPGAAEAAPTHSEVLSLLTSVSTC